MNQNLQQNINGTQPPQKNNTLKIVLIIIGSIFGIVVVGIIAFFFLVYVIFNKTIETFNENREEIHENSNSSISNGNEEENESNEDDDEEIELVKEYSHIEKINLKTLKELIDQKRSFTIVISQTYCGHCIEYKPTFNKVLSDNNVIGYELDLLTLKKSEYDEFNSLLTVSGTPTTLIYIDGIAQTETLEGSVTQSEVTTYLKKYGFIK